MYQLGTKWKLWDLPSFMQSDVDAISLRGYNKEPELSLPAELYAARVDDRGRFQGLSVEAITSRYCPTGRDIYLERKLGLRGQHTWGRVAGGLVERYCVGLLKHFEDLAQRPDRLSYRRIQTDVEEYSQVFWGKRSHRKQLEKLREEAGFPEESPERLAFLLQRTARYELAMLGADYFLGQNENESFVSLMQSIPIIFDERSLRITPARHLGLSEVTTPDFIIHAPIIVLGEVKTGTRLQPFHLHTVAGYALAYESQHHQDVNFGAVYFFETHATQMGFAQCYIFVVDDFLRRKFLDARNDAYKILQGVELPSLPKDDKDRETHCRHCRHYTDCYQDANG